MAVDIKSLTLGEIDFFENATGKALSVLGEPGAHLGKPLITLVYLFKARENSNFSMEDARKFTTEQATEYLGLGEEPEEESEEGKEERSQTTARKSKRAS